MLPHTPTPTHVHAYTQAARTHPFTSAQSEEKPGNFSPFRLRLLLGIRYTNLIIINPHKDPTLAVALWNLLVFTLSPNHTHNTRTMHAWHRIYLLLPSAPSWWWSKVFTLRYLVNCCHWTLNANEKQYTFFAPRLTNLILCSSFVRLCDKHNKQSPAFRTMKFAEFSQSTSSVRWLWVNCHYAHRAACPCMNAENTRKRKPMQNRWQII